MAQDVRVIIREDGVLVVLDNETTNCFRSLGSATKRRASHVEPESWILRPVFHTLRLVFGDKGRMSNFTRWWPCRWRVNLRPVGGPILPDRWYNRGLAIEDEVEWLNEHLL